MLNKILRLCVGQRVKGRPSDIERNARKLDWGLVFPAQHLNTIDWS